jgi:hypothetical protein
VVPKGARIAAETDLMALSGAAPAHWAVESSVSPVVYAPRAAR